VKLRLAIACAALAGASTASADEPLRVFAAASLTDAVQTLAAGFDGGGVRTSFGSSAELARQIADGAPADVFLSASREWVDTLRERELLEGEPVVFARNALVCVAPKGGALRARGAADPAGLARALAPGELVAIADAGVPAGEYARAALARLGVLDALRPRLVGQKDVRAVLHAVERGEVAAGFVYASDARVAAVDVLFAFDPATHPPIELYAAVVRGARRPDAARRFVAHLRGEAGRAALRAAGFAEP
jgi:molybdate transport system substrate-binding protein